MMNYGAMLVEGRGTPRQNAGPSADDLIEAQRLYQNVITMGKVSRKRQSSRIAPRTTEDTPAVVEHMMQEAQRALRHIEALLPNVATRATPQPTSSPACTVM